MFSITSRLRSCLALVATLFLWQAQSAHIGAPAPELTFPDPALGLSLHGSIGAFDLAGASGSDLIAAYAEVGGFGARKGSMLLHRTGGKLLNRIGADYEQSENNYPFLFESTPDAIRGVIHKSNNQFWSTSAYYSADYEFSQTRKLFSSIRYDGFDRGLYSVLHRDLDQNARSQQDCFSLMTRYRHGIGGQSDLTFEGTARYTFDRFHDPKAAFVDEGLDLTGRSPAVGFLAQATLLITPAVTVTPLVGIVYETLSQDNTYFEEPGSARFDASRLSATIGSRLHASFSDRIRISGLYRHRYDLEAFFAEKGSPAGATSSGIHCPEIDLEFSFSPVKSLRFHTTALYHVRNPEFSEKFGIRGYLFGTPDLEPEERRQAGLGVEVERGFLKSSLTGTAGITDNKIRPIREPEGHFRLTSYSQVRHVGGAWNFELSPFSWIKISNRLSYTRNTLHNTGNPETEWLLEPLVPMVENRLDLDVNFRKFQAGHRFHYFSGYYASARNDQLITSEPVLSAYVGYELSRYFTLRYRIENYLNVFNEDFHDRNIPGRMHFFSVNMMLAPGKAGR